MSFHRNVTFSEDTVANDNDNANSAASKPRSSRMNMNQCPNCGACAVEHHEASGASICTECGIVVEENIMVSSVEFVEGAAGSSSMVGQFVSATSSKAYGGGGSARGGGRYGGYSRDSRETTLANGRRKIQEIAARLRLGNSFVDAAHRLYTIAVEKNFVQGRRSTHVIAACLYIACRQEKSQHMLIDFSDALQVNVYLLGTCFLKFRRLLGLKLELIDPALYVYRFAAHLDLDDKANAVSLTALRLVARMKRDWIVAGRRPAGICAAALLIASRAHGFSKHHYDVTRILRVCGMTVQTRVKEFETTPSSQLTLEQFHTSDLQREADPPIYTKNKIREARARAIEEGNVALLTSGALDDPMARSEKGAAKWRSGPRKLGKEQQKFQELYEALEQELTSTTTTTKHPALKDSGEDDEEANDDSKVAAATKKSTESDDDEDDGEGQEKEKEKVKDNQDEEEQDEEKGVDKEAPRKDEEIDEEVVEDEEEVVEEEEEVAEEEQEEEVVEEEEEVVDEKLVEEEEEVVEEDADQEVLEEEALQLPYQEHYEEGVDEENYEEEVDEEVDEEAEVEPDEEVVDEERKKDVDEEQDTPVSKKRKVSFAPNDTATSKGQTSKALTVVATENKLSSIPAAWKHAYPRTSRGRALILPDHSTPEERQPSTTPVEAKLCLSEWKQNIPKAMDEEIESLFRTDQEQQQMEVIFNKINKDYLINQERKESAKEDGEAESRPKRGSKRTKGDQTTEEQLMAAVTTRKVSRKINYDALSSLFDDSGSFSTEVPATNEIEDEPGAYEIL